MATIQSIYPSVSLPKNKSLFDFIFEKFEEYGNSVAVVDGISGKSFTYRDIKLLSRRIASALTRLGFKKGDVFGIISPNCPEFMLMHCGIARMGGIVSGVNSLYTEDELVYHMDQVAAKILITVPSLADKLLNVKSRLPKVQDVYVFGEADGCSSFDTLLTDDGGAFPEVVHSLDDTFALPFSSGTTGLPKGVYLTHKTVFWKLALLESHYDLMDTRPGETMLALLPYYHAYGLVVVMLHGLRAGARQVTMTRFEEENFLRITQDYKVNLMYLVPPLMVFLAKHPLVDDYDASSVRQITCGAAPLGGEISDAVKRRIGVKIIRQGYGLTETTSATHIGPGSRDAPPSSIGLLLPNTEAKIIDNKTGESLKAGADGELWLRGPQVTAGYLNDPAATAQAIDSDGWLHTGDVGHYDDEGYFYIVDRLKELIKYKGHQVPPAELEALLLTHPSISDAAVIGIHDDKAGEFPKAFVVRKNDDLTEQEVKDFVKEKAAPYKQLRGGVEFVESIPKSGSGKILRKKLRERTANPAKA